MSMAKVCPPSHERVCILQYNIYMNSNIPKSIKKGPSALAAILSIISIIIWVPHTLPFFANTHGVQTIFAIILLPIGIASFFCAYHFGLTIAKLSYGITKKHYIFWAYFWLIVVNIVCIIICFIIEIILAGNPIQMCFDYCAEVKISTAVICYITVTTIILLSGYFAIARYFKYVKKFHLPKPS